MQRRREIIIKMAKLTELVNFAISKIKLCASVSMCSFSFFAISFVLYVNEFLRKAFREQAVKRVVIVWDFFEAKLLLWQD